MSEPAGQPTAVAQRKLMTRMALAQTATELFLRRGYDATTVDEIAAAAEVSPRTFFRYFPAKSDIITAVARTSLDDVVAAIGALPELDDQEGDGPPPGSARVLAAVTEAVLATLAKVTPATVRSFEQLLATSEELRARWAEECRRNQGRVAAAIAAAYGLRPGTLWAQVAASAVIVTVETALAAWARSDAADPAATVAAALGLLAGLFPA